MNQELANRVVEYVRLRIALSEAIDNCWHGAMTRISGNLETIASDLASEGVDVSKFPTFE